MDGLTEPQRLVLFAGPHKSASSAVESFFHRYAKKEPLLDNWLWPVNGSKGLAGLTVDPSNGKIRKFERTISQAWSTGQNIVIGAEGLDWFLPPLQSKKIPRNGRKAVDLLLNWTTKEHAVLVVNYRSPRFEHLESLWHQRRQYLRPVIGQKDKAEFEHLKGRSFTEWFCDQNEITSTTWEDIAVQSNPLGLVDSLLKKNLSVAVVDMSGVTRDGLDTPHVIACEVLGVPCENGWVRGVVKKSYIKNKKSGSADLSARQREGVETILRMRDCSYQSLENNPRFWIIRRHDLFSDCDRFNDDSVIESMRNASVVVDMIEQVIGCANRSVPQTPLATPLQSNSYTDGVPSDNFSFQNLDRSIGNTVGDANVSPILLRLDDVCRVPVVVFLVITILRRRKKVHDRLRNNS